MQMHKGITSVSLVITIIILIILTAVSITIFKEALNEDTSTTKTSAQEACQHEYVITSKWDYWKECYKTISKCSKCGKEVE